MFFSPGSEILVRARHKTSWTRSIVLRRNWRESPKRRANASARPHVRRARRGIGDAPGDCVAAQRRGYGDSLICGESSRPRGKAAAFNRWHFRKNCCQWAAARRSDRNGRAPSATTWWSGSPWRRDAHLLRDLAREIRHPGILRRGGVLRRDSATPCSRSRAAFAMRSFAHCPSSHPRRVSWSACPIRSGFRQNALQLCPTTASRFCSSQWHVRSCSTPSYRRRGRVCEIQVKQPGAAPIGSGARSRCRARVLHELYDLGWSASARDEYLGTLVNAWLARGGEAGGSARRHVHGRRHAGRLSRRDADPDASGQRLSRKAPDMTPRLARKRDRAPRARTRRLVSEHGICGGVQTAPDHFLGDYPACKWRQFRACDPGRI